MEQKSTLPKKSNLQSFYDDLRVGFVQKQPAGIVKVFHIFVLYFGRSSSGDNPGLFRVI